MFMKIFLFVRDNLLIGINWYIRFTQIWPLSIFFGIMASILRFIWRHKKKFLFFFLLLCLFYAFIVLMVLPIEYAIDRWYMDLENRTSKKFVELMNSRTFSSCCIITSTLISRFLIQSSIIIDLKYTKHVLKNPFTFEPYDSYVYANTAPAKEPFFYCEVPIANFILLFKFSSILSSNSSFFHNYISIHFRKISCFFRCFRFFDLKNFISVYSKFLFKNFFVFWRPLIKKWSYFGIYRAYRSKWMWKD